VFLTAYHIANDSLHYRYLPVPVPCCFNNEGVPHAHINTNNTLPPVCRSRRIPGRAAQEEFTLQYRLEKGIGLSIADTTFVKSSQEMMGQEVKSTSTVLATTRLVPSEIRADGSTVLTVSPDLMRRQRKKTRGWTRPNP